ncbi:phage terminase large subunit [Megasphaera sp. SW808]|uniref:phage terminase large subunit n=1 Tax=Megasphaera sp. SW808 TaxID=2530045 RepID=UPI001438BF6E|nr:phage terminase large subunit [Megasphaera sp. SW808]
MTTQWTSEQIEAARKDFRKFLFILWDEIALPEPTEIQYAMATLLMTCPYKRFIIEGFRGVAKSFITCAYVVWSLWNNPQLKILIVSASKDRADANAVFIRRILYLLDFLSDLRPRDGQRNTQNLFDVGLAIPDISPSVKSVGITGQITGSRADILVADDVEIPNNSSTQVRRDKLFEDVKEFDAIIKPGESSKIIYLGTPQNEMSLYSELQNRGYETYIFPIVYPETPEERDFYGDRLAPYLAKRYDKSPAVWAGKPTDPRRFPEEEIEERKLSYGKAGFSLQFKLNTNLSDYEKFPLKVQDLIISDVDLDETSLKWAWASSYEYRLNQLPCVAIKGDYFHRELSRSSEVAKYTGTVMAIDPSGRGKDETAYAIVKYLNGYLFAVDIGGFSEGYSDSVLTQLANKAKVYGVNEIVVEANFGDGMFTQLFKPVLNKIHPCAIQEVKNTKQKEARIIDTLEPVMMRHKLIIPVSVIKEDYRIYEDKGKEYSLIYQMTRLSRDKGSLAHDDRLDSLTMAVSYWLEVMDRDAQTGMDEQMEEWLAAAMDEDRGIFSMLYKIDEGSNKNANIMNKKW